MTDASPLGQISTEGGSLVLNFIFIEQKLIFLMKFVTLSKIYTFTCHRTYKNEKYQDGRVIVQKLFVPSKLFISRIYHHFQYLKNGEGNSVQP